MCELQASCSFFESIEGCSNTIDAVKKILCQGDYTSCARFQVHKVVGVGQVPESLFPTDHIAAERIAAEKEIPA